MLSLDYGVWTVAPHGHDGPVLIWAFGNPSAFERLLERLCVELALVFQAKPQLTGLEVHLNRALLYPR